MISTQALKTILIGFVFLLVVNLSKAQKIWTLQECVNYALTNNISIKQSEINVELSDATLLQSKTNMIPSVNASASHNYNYGRSVDPFSNQFTTAGIRSNSLSLSSNVVLFGGFQLQNTLRQSKLNYMASKFDLEKIRNDISLNVVSAYLQILYSSDFLNTTNNRVDEFSKQLSRTKLLAEAGSLTKSNLLDAEAQLANEEFNKVTAENQLNDAYLSLAQLLELDSVTSLKVSVPESDITDLSILSETPQSIFSAAQQLPEIKSADLKVQAAEKGLSIARGGHSPTLTIFGSLNSGYSSATQQIAGNPTFDGYLPSGFTSGGDTVLTASYSYDYSSTPFSNQLDNNFNKAFGFSLNIPIFNGWSTQTNVTRAKLNLANSRYSAELIRNQLFKSIQQAHADALAGQKKYAAAQKTKEAYAESFTYAEKKFNAGLLSSVEFLTVRNNLSKAETDVLQAKYDFIFRIKILDFYSGKPLTL